MPDSTERPADQPCPCHNKTEAQIAMPYALFVFGLFGGAIVLMLAFALVLS